MTTNQEPNRRNDVIRCEQCGEDYSVTYKCCPFCDERPGRPRAGVNGRRVAGQGANPLQVVGLVISLVLIISALFIVFTTISPLLGKNDPTPNQSQSPASSSQSADSSSQSSPSGSQSTPDSSSGDISNSEGPAVNQTVNSISLNKEDFTLQPDQTHTLTATVDPTDAKITWTSSNDAAATVDENGKITNVNTGSSQVKVTITATAGDKSAECTVYCRGGSTGSNSTPSQDPNNSDSPSTLNKTGTISGAESGLNVRSGPGSSNEAIATLLNGTDVTILEDTGTGWYKISFAGMGGKDTVGYVSKDYVTIK